MRPQHGFNQTHDGSRFHASAVSRKLFMRLDLPTSVGLKPGNRPYPAWSGPGSVGGSSVRPGGVVDFSGACDPYGTPRRRAMCST